MKANRKWWNISKLTSARGSRHLRLRGEREEVMFPTEGARLTGWNQTVGDRAVGTKTHRGEVAPARCRTRKEHPFSSFLPSYTPLQHFPLTSPDRNQGTQERQLQPPVCMREQESMGLFLRQAHSHSVTCLPTITFSNRIYYVVKH